MKNRHLYDAGLLITLLIIVALSASGCANYSRMAPNNKDKVAKQFETVKDKAVIYVFRNKSGMETKMPVKINGHEVAKTRSHTFFRVEVNPGEHEISSDEGIFSSITINTVPGENYFILQEVVQSANKTGSNFLQVTDLEGKRSIKDCRLIKARKL